MKIRELTTRDAVHDLAGGDAIVAWATAELPARSRAWTGVATALCRFVVDALVSECGRATLMVDADNAPAIRIYTRLGLRWRDVSTAGLRAR